MRRVLVCGGRSFKDREFLFLVLDQHLARDDVIISGAARGADRLAIEYAVMRRLACERFPADWALYGKGAGPIRNQQMLDKGKPDLVIAFPGGTGTADMVARAKLAKIEVREIAR